MICETQLVSCKYKINTYLLVLFMGVTLSSLATRFEIFRIYLETFRISRCSWVYFAIFLFWIFTLFLLRSKPYSLFYVVFEWLSTIL